MKYQKRWTIWLICITSCNLQITYQVLPDLKDKSGPGWVVQLVGVLS